MATLFTAIFLAQEFHDISPPVNYSLLPMWAIFVTAFAALTVLGLLIWLAARRRKPTEPPKSPRERAIEALGRIQVQIESLNPYRFSIRVSDILRNYVTEQYDLPVTRQTSVEFLERLRKASPFSEDEKALLEDFLNRCDLIKFARYEATTADSRMLLEEATRFVQGGALAIA
jgi:membrane protein implicated in regulation of membrane protease activity